MSEFLVPDDARSAPRPEPPGRGAAAPRSGALTCPAATVRVTAVPGGVRLTFAPTGNCALADAIAAALVDVAERERRDGGGFLQVTIAEQREGAAVSLTITGPRELRAPAIAPGRVLVRDTPSARP